MRLCYLIGNLQRVAGTFFDADNAFDSDAHSNNQHPLSAAPVARLTARVFKIN